MSNSAGFAGQAVSHVRAQILFPFALLILFVVGAFLFTAYLSESREYEEVLTASAIGVDRVFQQSMEHDTAMMQAALSVIARDEEIKRAFIKGDREALLKLVWPLFDNLRANNHVSHFYFTDSNRVNFLRVHKPDEYGDTINRITTLRVANAKVPARGIEVGPLGTFSLRVVVPWYEGETLIGFLELGEELDHIVDKVQRILGVDLLVLVHERFLSLEKWRVGKKMLGNHEEWPRFGDMAVVGRAMQNIPAGLVTVLRRSDNVPKEPVNLQESGKDLNVTFLPLLDIAKREVGYFAIVRDITSARAGYRNSMALAAVVVIVVGAIVFAIFFVILGKVERDYKCQRQIELQLSRIDSEHQKVVQVEKLSAMGLMIGEIAHQLNNPLVGVVNMAQLAEREVEDPQRMRELLGEIGKAGKDCHAFVKRMLGFTKISKLERQPTDMKQLVEETISLFRQSVGYKPSVVSELPQQAPVLDVDPVLIRHALFNLLNNAAQVSPADGTVIVSLTRTPGPREQKPGWCLAVGDQGPGLSNEVVEKMFTPFFTTHAEGTGLGLPVVQHVAIVHEGHISATNIEGGGALFALWLPVLEVD